MTEKQAQTIEWSPDLWIRDTATQDYLQQNSKTKLSFKDIIHIGTILQENKNNSPSHWTIDFVKKMSLSFCLNDFFEWNYYSFFVM